MKVTPVVDLNRNLAVDAYEAPDRIRALVDERDHTCVFPFSTNRGRFDLDHTIEYVDPDTGGPPAAYLWTSPLGYTYLVTGTGTYPRD